VAGAAKELAERFTGDDDESTTAAVGGVRSSVRICFR